MSQNQCPHPKCEAMKPTSMYACRSHWFSLPKNIKAKIWRGYKENASLWLEADKEAIAFWNSKIQATP